MMQKLKIKTGLKVLAVALLLGAMASCRKSFFTEVNTNPNAPRGTSVTPGVLLSTVEGTLAYTQGGDLSRYTALITQQVLGASRQSEAYYQYVFTSTDVDRLWGNMYTSVFENNKVLMQKADSLGYNTYAGVSRILMAYALQITVDAYGSLPYTQAFKGLNLFQPAYDSDKALYDTIAMLVDKGIALVRNPEQGRLVPGSEDVIYEGDTSRWIKFGHAVKARLYIHQSKNSPAMANAALTEISRSFTSNEDNAQYKFGETETSSNPWYQFNQQRADISFDESTLADQLLATGDPRFDVFIDSSFNDVNGVGMGAYYGSVNAPVEFITYDELLFMKAEATIRSTGAVPGAQGFYQAAIRANMEKLGVSPGDINTYLAQNGTLPLNAADAIKKVAAQEYIALYLNPEAWTLWRRTGSPTLTPVTGNSVPRRLLYPQSEYSYNSAHVPASVTLYAPRIFWDN